MAFQGWRAVVLHMAMRREQLQQAALASADRAIRKGCHAAAQPMLACLAHHNRMAASEVPQLRLLELEYTQHPKPGHRRRVSNHSAVSTDQLSCAETAVDAVQQRGNDAAELTAAFFKASAHWSEKLQAKVLRAWRELSQQAIVCLWQQHELKSLTNEQLLQVGMLIKAELVEHATVSLSLVTHNN